MSCILYVVRHGIAAPSDAATADADRCLTEEGIRKMRCVARGLKRLGIVPDAVLSSPLRRAEETATLLATALAPDLAVEIYPPLAPGNPVNDVLSGLRQHRRARHLILVGHQPDLGELASQLLTGSATLMPLPFKKGAVAAIEVETLPPRSRGALLWFLAPRHLCALGPKGK